MDPWEALNKAVARFANGLAKVGAVQVRSAGVRDLAKKLVQFYFREARPHCRSVGVDESELVEIDHTFQNINSLALTANRKSSYIREVTSLRKGLQDLSMRMDMLIGEANVGKLQLTQNQRSILVTLERMVPSAALSLRQALQDLAEVGRVSFRGPAAELREALRETIDHLAPDDAVTSAHGFQFDVGKTRPTTKQKIRFIMKSRGKSNTISDTTVDAASRAESGAESLARSLQNRGSLATHVATAKGEIRNLQRYTEVVLSELLEI